MQPQPTISEEEEGVCRLSAAFWVLWVCVERERQRDRERERGRERYLCLRDGGVVEAVLVPHFAFVDPPDRTSGRCFRADIHVAIPT